MANKNEEARILKYLEECEDIDDDVGNEFSDHLEYDLHDDTDDTEVNQDFIPDEDIYPQQCSTFTSVPTNDNEEEPSSKDKKLSFDEPVAKKKKQNLELEQCVVNKNKKTAETSSKIVVCDKRILKGQGKKTTQTWYSEPTEPSQRTRHSGRDIIHIRRDPAREANNIPADNVVLSEQEGRKICAFCPSRKRRMTRFFCSRCSKAMCGEHQSKCCYECTANL